MTGLFRVTFFDTRTGLNAGEIKVFAEHAEQAIEKARTIYPRVGGDSLPGGKVESIELIGWADE